MKILVLQLKRIGDLILTTPALAALRQHYPEAKITLAVEESCKDLLPGIPHVDRTMIFRRKKSNVGLWRKLALSRFDTALDFTGSDRSAFYAVLSKSKQRVCFEWVKKSRFRAFFYNRLVDSPVRERHTVDHYLDLLSPLGVRNGAASISLRVPPEADQKVAQLLSAQGITGDFFVVHPGTARVEKYWPAERWAEVIEFCARDLKMPCVITGGKDEFEQTQIAAIKVRCNCVDLSGKLDLLGLAALAKEARLVLSVDSAPMHLAAAFQTPQVALFGPTNPFHWHPRHDRAVLVRAGHAALDAPLKPKERGVSMSEISTQQVLGAILASKWGDRRLEAPAVPN
jgi:predicted lipopolysaccharide heptosyltransferase III